MKYKIKIISILLTLILIFSLFILQRNLYADECECTKNGDNIASVYDKNKTLYDIYGNIVDFKKVPKSVVSLVPAITEMIEAVNPDYKLKGVTYFDSKLSVSENAEFVGSFYTPDAEKIKTLKPELIIAASLHSEIHKEFKNTDTRVIILDAHNANGIYRNIEIIGKIFHNEKNAEKTINDIKNRIANIQKKLTTIPADKRKRVMRLMSFDEKVYTPGDDSFQTEAIKLAGGIPITTGRNGQITYVDPDQWKKFNPQVLYSCGDSTKMWNDLSKTKPWNTVDAIKTNNHLVYNCNLTCRPSVNYGKFIEMLSSNLYKEYFFTNPPVKKDGYDREKKINVNVPYVTEASVKYGTIDDFENKTLVIKFNKEYDVLSTLLGWKKANTVGNHYLCPPRWDYGFIESLDDQEKRICNSVNVDYKSASFLITSANLDNLAVIEKKYKKYTVYAFVTAGVTSNAQRQAKDEGLYYPHGTINMIILTNTKLSGGAMGRAIISATEAKTAALQDLDIRSNYTPIDNQATGTGTDNIIVVSGDGLDVDSTGGHTKMGELIAKAAYEGVLEAVRLQNKIIMKRTIYERLDDRKISITGLLSYTDIKFSADEQRKIKKKLEKILSDKDIVEFLETAFAVTDAIKHKKISGSSFFNQMSLEIAGKISGKKTEKLIPVKVDPDNNSPLNMAFSVILTGVINSVK